MVQNDRPFRSRRFAISGVIALALLVCAWAVLQQSGPRVAVGPEPPIDRLNRQYGDIWPNAADHYEELLALLPRDLLQNWSDHSRPGSRPLSQEIVAWLDDHEDFAELARLAAGCERCYFKLSDSGGGFSSAGVFGQWRLVGSYLALRARRAADAHDLTRFRDSVWMLDRLGRHSRQQPFVIAQVFQAVFRLQAQEWLLVPLTWPELTDTERDAYVSAAEELCEELPLEIQPFRDEAELSGWSMRKALGMGQRMLVSRARLNGELQKQLDPFETLLRQTVEQRVTPGNSLRMALAPGPPRRTPAKYIFNLPGVIADLAAYSLDGFIQSDAKLVATQRGTLAALRVHRHRLRTGEWPKSLAETGAPTGLDPFAVRPYRYRWAGDDFVLYGVGIDGDDDGGTPYLHPRRNRPWNGATAGDGDALIWPLWEECDEYE